MGPSCRPLSILLCEDDEISLGLLHGVISTIYPDTSVHCASNGRNGLESFREHLPDILITDIQMPYMDGVEMTAAIQSIKPDVKTIVITAYGAKTIKQSTAKIPIKIDHYFLKPLDYKQLFEAIDDCVAQVT